MWHALQSDTSSIKLNLSDILEDLLQEVFAKAIEYLVSYKKELKELDLSGNQLTSLPNGLRSLACLEWIDLSGNAFSPEQLEQIL